MYVSLSQFLRKKLYGQTFHDHVMRRHEVTARSAVTPLPVGAGIWAIGRAFRRFRTGLDQNTAFGHV